MGLSPSAFVIGPSSFENDIRTDRKLVEWLGGNLSGVADAASMLVSPVSGQHQISIAPGSATLVGRSTPASQGSYHVWSDAADVIALPATQANPFIVAVVLRVADPQYGVVSGTVGARYDLVPGTAAASPVAPSDADITAYGGGVPGAWIRLADVRINTADTGAIPGGQFTDLRGYYVPGGMYVICTNTNRPPHKVGRRIFEYNTGHRYTSDGTNWIEEYRVNLAWDPTLKATTTNPTNQFKNGWWKREGSIVTCQFGVQITAAGSGTYFVDLPFTAATFAAAGVVGAFKARNSGVGSYAGVCEIVVSNLARVEFKVHATGSDSVTHSNPAAWASGSTFSGMFSYLVA